VTTPAIGSGRPSATFRPIPGTLRLLAIGLLAAAAVPALAAPAAGEALDPTELTPSLMTAQGFGGGDQVHVSLASARDMRTLFHHESIGFAVPASDATDEATSNGDGRIQRLINRGLALLGTPYRWGGTSPEKGFDCSGLVGYVYKNTLGIELPRISRDMANVGELISSRDDLQQGDLVFFSRRGGRIDHVGLYLGEGRFLHAPRTGKDVEVTTLTGGYWSKHFVKGRRVAPVDAIDSDSEMAVANTIDAGQAEAKTVGTQQ
jgi:cell wall-associated NlpC family hydrolase